jgi:transcriptional regulator with XRE-family HTH domain
MAARRRELGWSQNTAARKLGVDLCTWSAWEASGTVLFGTHRQRLAEFLCLPEAEKTCSFDGKTVA